MNNLATKSLLIICIALAFLLFRECESNKECREFEEPEGLITDAEANQLEDNYTAKVEAGNISLNDTREVYFDFDELEDYVKYVKHQSDSLGYTNLGMRVYFGSKQANGTMETTVFFVPTNSETTRAQDAPNERVRSRDIKQLNMGDPGMTDFVYP